MNNPVPPTQVSTPHDLLGLAPQAPFGWLWRYGFAVAAVLAAWGLRLSLEAWVGPGLPTYVTFYPMVMVAALLGGFGPGMLATATAGTVAMLFILPPHGQLTIALPVERLGLAIFLSMGLFMSLVAHLYRRNQRKAVAYDREQELRELNREKAFLASLLENADQPFAVGYPDGRLGLVNRAFEQLTGYSAVELRTIDWSLALTPPEWREKEREKLTELQRLGQPVRYEKEYLRKDGSRVPIELQVNVVLDRKGNPEYYYSFLSDISERKLAEQVLRDNELKASALINAADESILLFDPEGMVLAANHTAARRLDMSVEELVGRNWQELVPPALLVSRKAKAEEVFLSGSPAHFEDERAGMTFEHSVYPVRNSSGALVATAFFSRDITERKRAEQERERLTSELQQRATELDTVFKALPVLVSLHAHDGKYLRVNPALVELFGIDPTHASREEIARRLRARFADGRPLTPENMPSSRVLRGETISGVEYLVTDGQGRERVLLFNAVPLQIAGRVYGMVLAQMDITERKEAETKINLLNEQLARKVTELETANQELEGFTYSVSHDLRAPIRHIAGFAKVLERKSGPEFNAEARKHLAIIATAADRLGILTDELLEFSRMGRKEIGMAEVDLGALIGETVEHFQKTTATRRITWRVGELPVVNGDATMLRFVVENLISNAVKYTGKREQAHIEIGCREDAQRHIIFVKDNGVGFDMAYYDKLFGVFHRLHSKDEFEGTGIGLANVQRIIQRHQGEVWAESDVNAGATFYFSLPKAPQG